MNTFFLMGAMAIAALFGAVGQLMMSKASSAQLSVTGILLNPWLWGFAACYGVGVIINFFAYRAGGSVSTLYPIISLSYVFAAFLAWRFLNQVPNKTVVIGICIIVLGVSLIGWGSQHG